MRVHVRGIGLWFEDGAEGSGGEGGGSRAEEEEGEEETE